MSRLGSLVDDNVRSGRGMTVSCRRKMRACNDREAYANCLLGRKTARIVFESCRIIVVLRHTGSLLDMWDKYTLVAQVMSPHGVG